MRERDEEAAEERLHDLDDEVEVALEFQAVGGEDRLEETAEVQVDCARILGPEGGTVAGTEDC